MPPQNHNHDNKPTKVRTSPDLVCIPNENILNNGMRDTVDVLTAFKELLE